MKSEALFYFDKFGFNITKLTSTNSIFNIGKDKFKHPSHDWKYLSHFKQKRSELEDVSWDNIHGIGTVLEYNNLRALDIDDCNDENFIFEILEILNLPKNYEWTVKSGSQNGYHILFYADNNRISDFESIRVAYGSKSPFRNVFRKIEFRWKSHLVLPPSKHRSGGHYDFLNNFPRSKPVFVKIENVLSLIQKYCSLKLDGVNRIVPLTAIPTHFSSSEEESSEEESSEEESSEEESRKEESSEEESSEEDLRKRLQRGRENRDDNDDDLSHIDNYEQEDEQTKRIEKRNDFSKIDYYLFIDTETTGLPNKIRTKLNELEQWPRIVQIAWILSDSKGNIISNSGHIIKPNGFLIPDDSVKIHGISNLYAIKNGVSIYSVLKELLMAVNMADCIVAHNLEFDEKTIWSEFHRLKNRNPFRSKLKICTMEGTTDFCKIKTAYGYKWPSLGELYFKLFQDEFEEEHNAEYDIQATFKCFWELRKLGKI